MARTARRTVTVACSLASTSIPIPRIEIGWWEGICLTCRGYVDRLGNRHVADTTHTHTLHLLERRHRRMESEVVRKIDTLISPIAVRKAQLEVITGSRIDDPATHPSHDQLAELHGRERFNWAAQWREATEAKKLHAAQQARAAAAKSEVATLEEERHNVLIEGDDIRLQWREAHMLRAARYTRARFGGWGAKSTPDPAVSEYNFAAGPRQNRETEPGKDSHPGIG